MAAVVENTLPDISGLSLDDIAALQTALQTRRQELYAATENERKTAFNAVKKSDKAKAFKADVKVLQKEYDALCKNAGHNLTYTVPLTLNVTLSSPDGYDSVSSIEELLNAGSDLDWQSLFHVSVEGSIGKTDLPKSVKDVMQENIDGILQDACEEVHRLVPDIVKQCEAFAKKAAKVVAVGEKLVDGHDFEVSELVS